MKAFALALLCPLLLGCGAVTDFGAAKHHRSICQRIAVSANWICYVEDEAGNSYVIYRDDSGKLRPSE
jgi:hypothetical protein